MKTLMLLFAESQSAHYIKKYIKNPYSAGKRNGKNCTKAAITKQYFPTVQERLKTKMRFTQNIAAMMTGHGKTRAYLHRFKILENATRSCEQGDQTIDHLL